MKKQQWLSHPSWWKSCDFPPLRNQMCTVKGSVSRDVIPLFFSWFEPIWATDKQAKVFSNYCSISPRYSITKLCAAHCGGKFFYTRKKKHTTFKFIVPHFSPLPTSEGSSPRYSWENTVHTDLELMPVQPVDILLPRATQSSLTQLHLHRS